MSRRTAIDRPAAVRRRGRWIRIDTTGAYRQRLSQPIRGASGGTRTPGRVGLIRAVETGIDEPDLCPIPNGVRGLGDPIDRSNEVGEPLDRGVPVHFHVVVDRP